MMAYKDRYTFPAVFLKYKDTYNLYYPDLPGCVEIADTLEELLNGTKEGLELHLWGMQDSGEAIPEPSSLENITLHEGEQICYVSVDLRSIRAEMDTRPVKKTLTIPWNLNYLAEQQHINFSQLLQAALKERLGLN